MVGGKINVAKNFGQCAKRKINMRNDHNSTRYYFRIPCLKMEFSGVIRMLQLSFQENV